MTHRPTLNQHRDSRAALRPEAPPRQPSPLRPSSRDPKPHHPRAAPPRHCHQRATHLHCDPLPQRERPTNTATPMATTHQPSSYGVLIPSLNDLVHLYHLDPELLHLWWVARWWQCRGGAARGWWGFGSQLLGRSGGGCRGGASGRRVARESRCWLRVGLSVVAAVGVGAADNGGGGWRREERRSSLDHRPQHTTLTAPPPHCQQHPQPPRATPHTHSPTANSIRNRARGYTATQPHPCTLHPSRGLSHDPHEHPTLQRSSVFSQPTHVPPRSDRELSHDPHEHPASLNPINLPPGPSGFPIFGNLLSLDPELHSYSVDLARTYGPVVKLRLGGKLGIIVTSPFMARQVLQDHDTIFANRDNRAASKIASYGGNDIVSASYGPKWRMLRKVCMLKMLSNTTLDSVYEHRRTEVRKMVKFIYSQVELKVNIGEQAFLTQLNVITNMMWGGGIEEVERERVGAEFRETVAEMTSLLGKLNVSDLFPWLARFDLQGVEKQMNELVPRFDQIFDKMISQRVKMKKEERKKERKDFLQFLLDLKEEEDSQTPLTITQIKALLLDS
ncbi:hypothetical protein RIF29_34216 [Crotalaria pallida]|uniref:Cytochrome P450 n=1 Tax=Crotalaria pallida TaxID=3830 RepID=A0AAN9E8Q6_CROPI